MSDENLEKYVYKLEDRIEELEKVIKRHKLGIKGEFYFLNKQTIIEKNEEQIAELKEGCRLLNDQKNTNKEVLRELITEIFIFTYPTDPEERKKVEIQKYRELLAKLDSGGEKEGSRVEVPNKKKGKIPQIELDNSKPPDIPLEPELEFGGKNVIKMPTDFNSNPLKPKFSYNSNYKTSEPFSEKPPELHFCKNCGNEISDIEDYVQNLNEPREDDVINLGDLLREKGILPQKADLIIADFDKDYIIVKREKIEFWRKELLNKTDEVLKSMREVLGS